jgi:hypothetical protein
MTCSNAPIIVHRYIYSLSKSHQVSRLHYLAVIQSLKTPSPDCSAVPATSHHLLSQSVQARIVAIQVFHRLPFVNLSQLVF